MVTTRSQEKASGVEKPLADTNKPNASLPSKRTSKSKDTHTDKSDDVHPSKRPRKGENKEGDEKQAKPAANGAKATSKVKSLADQVLAKCGDPPFKDLVDDKWPLSNIVMVHILNALLSSTRISHQIASKTLACLVEENYQDLRVLGSTSWQARTEVLTRGGYVHYREKTATYLGDLCELMSEKFGKHLLPRRMEMRRRTNFFHP